ncbi:putative reverse transcriptase zinc-binding domain-containing protein [Helianthus annuus]|nr:putative reverse transcriptase zinc-binding domain-containing protein [Helianthus annuus]
MQSRRRPGLGQGFVWNSLTPLKVNFLLWRVYMGRVPTRVALQNRNIQVGVLDVLYVVPRMNRLSMYSSHVHLRKGYGMKLVSG